MFGKKWPKLSHALCFYSGASVVILFAIEANLLFEEAHSFARPPNRCPKFFMTSACQASLLLK